MSKKKRKKSSKHVGIPGHKRYKSKLLNPLHGLPIETVEWERDLLPEHIWIECLSSAYPEHIWFSLYQRFLDELEKCCPEGVTIYGFITDFGLIPCDKRKEFLINNKQLIYESFYKSIGRIIAFYPESPAHWLLRKECLERGERLDPAIELQELSSRVLRLLPGKDSHAGHIRVFPLTRILKQKRLRFRQGMEVAKLLPKYPKDCTDEERYFVQQFARTIMNMEYLRSEHYKSREWPKYFWRHNFDIVPCQSHSLNLGKSTSLALPKVRSVYKLLEKNANIVIEYLNDVSAKHKWDLYSPGQDEILMGLFSRLTRLYVLIARSPDLWARDIAGIITRCLVDTAITFAYLVKVGTDKDFENFRSYGEGKEKLLMLHLQDTYPGEKSLEGKSSEEIANELGSGLTPELIDIELANWTTKSARDLAIKADLEEFYRLVYDPTSSDVHGTWTSIKNFNLVRCSQPLHRFHRMPQYYEPPLFVNTIDVAQRIYLRCIDIGIDTLQFPGMKSQIEGIISFLK